MLEQIADTDLKTQVETLLADEGKRKDFLESSNTTNQLDQEKQDVIGPGSLINRIRIIKLLGQGGMGSVYLGFDEKLERQVAVKSIRPEHLKNKSTQQRFVREAQILSKINHPSICQLYDYLETADGDFLVLEYIKGKPLYQVPLDHNQKLKALVDLATALSVAHEHGIVHRDLKPDNIMVTDEGQLKVLDFGIAQSLSKPSIQTSDTNKRVSDDLTQQGSLVGTIRYMSPEQAQGKNIDTASDMYAFGIIAQEVFSHKAAYEVLETEQLLADVQQGKRIDVTELPVSIRSLIENLTALNPEQRPSSTTTITQLNDILDKPKRRKKKVTISMVGLIGGLLLIMLWFQWQKFNIQAERNELVNSYQFKIDDLVNQAEEIYVLPVHPVNDSIQSIINQGNELFEVISKDQRLSDKEKKRLMGIILLKGEYYAEAIALLQESQAENQLLADAWTMLYIEKATEFSDKHGMEKTLQDSTFRTQYLTPTLQYIELAHQDAGQVDPLFEAFVLSQTESLASGLTAVNKILKDQQWNKKAVNLKALILSASMTKSRENGDWEEAKKYALMTAETYQRSNQMARSFPPSYNSLCYVSLGLLADAFQRSGEDVESFANQGIEACNNALKLQPDFKYPMTLLTNIYMIKAQWQISRGIDANESLAQVKHWNQRSFSFEDLFTSTLNQAMLHAIEAKQFLQRGHDAQTAISQAHKLYTDLLKVDNEYQPFVTSDMLFVLSLQGHEQIRNNQDPTETFNKARELYDHIMLYPGLMIHQQKAIINNMADVLLLELLFQLKQGQNILSAGNALLALLEPGDNLVQNDPSLLINLANTHLLMAEYLRQQKQSFTDHIRAANEQINEAKSINSTDLNIKLSEANLLTLQHYLSDQNYKPVNDLYDGVVNTTPNNPYGFNTWAESLMVQAQNPATEAQQIKALKMAAEKITQALSIDPNNQVLLNTQTDLFELAAKLNINLPQP
ncbi:MAG: protein kinase domain-containing protein [Marinicella sp.]